MSLEDFKLIDNETIDNSTIKRDFIKVYHQQGANSSNNDPGIDFF